MIDIELRNQIVKEIPEILKCFQCGTCVSSCPAEKYGKGYSPRRKILEASYGNKEIFSTELWRCLTCNTCNERCPQDVNPYDVLIKLKNMACREEIVELPKAAEIVIETGRSVKASDRNTEQRRALGLAEIKYTDELKKLKNRTRGRKING